MRVRVTRHTDSDVAPWWYQKRIGEVFEVVPDEVKPSYFLTTIDFKGKLQKRHIKKVDCEVVE